MGASTGRAERERERLRKLEAKRKQQRWLNPSAAQLQCEHEYMDWVLARVSESVQRTHVKTELQTPHGALRPALNASQIRPPWVESPARRAASDSRRAVRIKTEPKY